MSPGIPKGRDPAQLREAWHHPPSFQENDAAFALQSPDATREQVVEILVRTFYTDLFRLAKVILGDLVLAGKLTRATLLAAATHRGEFQGQVSPQAWLYAIQWHLGRRRYPWHVRHASTEILPHLQHLPPEEIAYVLQTNPNRLPRSTPSLPDIPPPEPLTPAQVQEITRTILPAPLSAPRPALGKPFTPELRWVGLALLAILFLFMRYRISDFAGEGQPLFPTAAPTLPPTPTAVTGVPLLRFTAPHIAVPLELTLPQISTDNDESIPGSTFPLPWTEQTALPGVSAWIASAAFTPQGGLLVAGDSNGRLHVSNAGEETQYTLTAHDTWITHLAFSPLVGRLNNEPTGQFILASGDTMGIVKLWQISASSGVWRFVLAPHPRPIYDLAFSSDGKYLAVAHETGVWLWALQPTSAALLHAWEIGKAASLAFHPHRSLLALAHSDGNTWFVTIPEGDITARLDWDDGHTSSLAWSPDGQFLATGDRKGQVNIWKVALSAGQVPTLTWLKRFQHERPVIALAISPDGEYLAAAVEARGLWVWNLGENVPAQVTFTDPRTTARAVVFSPESAWLAAVGAQGGVLLLARSSASNSLSP